MPRKSTGKKKREWECRWWREFYGSNFLNASRILYNNSLCELIRPNACLAIHWQRLLQIMFSKDRFLFFSWSLYESWFNCPNHGRILSASSCRPLKPILTASFSFCPESQPYLVQTFIINNYTNVSSN